MDPGTNARDVLDGQSVRLKHGWIGIVNRGQADIMSKVSVEEVAYSMLWYLLGSRPHVGHMMIVTKPRAFKVAASNENRATHHLYI